MHCAEHQYTQNHYNECRYSSLNDNMTILTNTLLITTDSLNTLKNAVLQLCFYLLLQVK